MTQEQDYSDIFQQYLCYFSFGYKYIYEIQIGANKQRKRKLTTKTH